MLATSAASPGRTSRLSLATGAASPGRTSRLSLEPPAESLTLSTVMAALSDPARVEIVRVLAAEGERTCGTFDLGLSKATRSHHFKVLREAGLTHTRAEGTHRHVSLRRDDVDARFPGLLGAVLAAAQAELSAAPA